MMFTIEMLPASNGDCLWIEYGTKRAPRRILVDGGRATTYDHIRERIERLPRDDRAFELLVVTHVDNDHIYGILKLLEDRSHGATFRDIWFNGYRHLPETPPDLLGPVQGERLTELLSEAERPWNDAWDDGAVAITTRDTLPAKALAGRMKLTLLSPTLMELAALRPEWKKVVIKAGLVNEEDAEEERDPDDGPPDLLGGRPDPNPDPRRLAESPFKEDGSRPNGSSIALLAEYRGKRLLLAGDAYPSVMQRSLATLARMRGGSLPPIDVLKISHHGGRKNTSMDLLRDVECRRFLISTNGSSFGHPHDESIGRAIVAHEGATLYFNHRNEITDRWDTPRLKRTHGYDAVYPEEGSEGLVVAV